MDGVEKTLSSGRAAATTAYTVLERMIVTLELAPGASVSEAVLMQLSGLGRTPVREAIQRLEWEGFVKVRPRSGIGIAPLNLSDWIKVIDTRKGLEMLLARSAARLAGDAQKNLFDEVSIAMSAAAEAQDANAFLIADKQFDEALAIAADNQFASRLVAPLQTHSRRFWYRFRNVEDLESAARHHLSIIAAIMEGNPDQAEIAAARWMDSLRKIAIAFATA